ncbi:MAG: 4-alpha-glucanotransferase [Gallintestinimicrobium sp.]
MGRSAAGTDKLWGLPYQSFSTYAGNPYFIDLEELVEAGFLTRKEVEACDCGKAARDIDYGKLYENRMPLLKLAYERSLEKPDPKFTAFWTENAWWLDDYGLFMAVKDIFDGNSWDQWAEDIRYRWDNAMWYYKTNYSKEIGFYVWLQYLFFTQWQKLKNMPMIRD